MLLSHFFTSSFRSCCVVCCVVSPALPTSVSLRHSDSNGCGLSGRTAARGSRVTSGATAAPTLRLLRSPAGSSAPARPFARPTALAPCWTALRPFTTRIPLIPFSCFHSTYLHLLFSLCPILTSFLHQGSNDIFSCFFLPTSYLSHPPATCSTQLPVRQGFGADITRDRAGLLPPRLPRNALRFRWTRPTTTATGRKRTTSVQGVAAGAGRRRIPGWRHFGARRAPPVRRWTP